MHSSTESLERPLYWREASLCLFVPYINIDTAIVIPKPFAIDTSLVQITFIHDSHFIHKVLAPRDDLQRNLPSKVHAAKAIELNRYQTFSLYLPTHHRSIQTKKNYKKNLTFSS